MSLPFRITQLFPCVSVIFLSLSPDALATTLVFSRSQNLEGWHERLFTTSWTDLAPDVKSLISTDINGDLRGFAHPTTTTWLQSPSFVLGVGEISIASIHLMGGVGSAPGTDAEVSPTKSSSGWAGIALRDMAGNFVFTYSSPTEWAPVTFTEATLTPYVGQTLTLDFISMNNSNGDFFYVNRPISIETSVSSVPEPASMVSVAALICSGLFLRQRHGRRAQ